MKKLNYLLLSFLILLKTSPMLAAQQTFYCIVGQAEQMFPDEYEFGFYDTSISLKALRDNDDVIGGITKIAYLNTASASEIATIDITSQADDTELKTILEDNLFTKDRALTFTVEDLTYLNELKGEDLKDGITLPSGKKIKSDGFGNSDVDYRFALDNNNNLDPLCAIKNQNGETVKTKLTETEIFANQNKGDSNSAPNPSLDNNSQTNDDNQSNNNTTSHTSYLTNKKLWLVLFCITFIFYLIAHLAVKEETTRLEKRQKKDEKNVKTKQNPPSKESGVSSKKVGSMRPFTEEQVDHA